MLFRSEIARIKKSNKENAAELELKSQELIQKEKSDKIMEMLSLTDDKIKSLIGSSFVEWKEIGEQVIFAARVYLKAKSRKVDVITCTDHMITDKSPDKYGNLPKDAQIKIFNSAVGIPKGWIGVAPGPKSLDVICRNVKSAYMLILAGSLSIEDPRVEEISKINKKLFDAIRFAKNKGAITVAAGGDTAAAVRAFNGEGAFTVVSNAGGATLELIEKSGKLPGIEAVKESYEKKFN